MATQTHNYLFLNNSIKRIMLNEPKRIAIFKKSTKRKFPVFVSFFPKMY